VGRTNSEQDAELSRREIRHYDYYQIVTGVDEARTGFVLYHLYGFVSRGFLGCWILYLVTCGCKVILECFNNKHINHT
jgi:hypothetical protein